MENNEGSDISSEINFRKNLEEMCKGDKKTVLITKEEYYNLVDELKTANSAKSKYRRQHYILAR